MGYTFLDLLGMNPLRPMVAFGGDDSGSSGGGGGSDDGGSSSSGTTSAPTEDITFTTIDLDTGEQDDVVTYSHMGNTYDNVFDYHDAIFGDDDDDPAPAVTTTPTYTDTSNIAGISDVSGVDYTTDDVEDPLDAFGGSGYDIGADDDYVDSGVGYTYDPIVSTGTGTSGMDAEPVYDPVDTSITDTSSISGISDVSGDDDPIVSVGTGTSGLDADPEDYFDPIDTSITDTSTLGGVADASGVDPVDLVSEPVSIVDPVGSVDADPGDFESFDPADLYVDQPLADVNIPVSDTFLPTSEDLMPGITGTDVPSASEEDILALYGIDPEPIETDLDDLLGGGDDLVEGSGVEADELALPDLDLPDVGGDALDNLLGGGDDLVEGTGPVDDTSGIELAPELVTEIEDYLADVDLDDIMGGGDDLVDTTPTEADELAFELGLTDDDMGLPDVPVDTGLTDEGTPEAYFDAGLTDDDMGLPDEPVDVADDAFDILMGGDGDDLVDTGTPEVDDSFAMEMPEGPFETPEETGLEAMEEELVPDFMEDMSPFEVSEIEDLADEYYETGAGSDGFTTDVTMPSDESFEAASEDTNALDDFVEPPVYTDSEGNEFSSEAERDESQGRIDAAARRDEINTLIGSGVDPALATAAVDIGVDPDTLNRDERVSTVEGAEVDAEGGDSDLMNAYIRDMNLRGRAGETLNAAETETLRDLLRFARHEEDVLNPETGEVIAKAGELVYKPRLGDTIENIFTTVIDYLNPLSILGEGFSVKSLSEEETNALLDLYEKSGEFIYGSDGKTVIGVRGKSYAEMDDDERDAEAVFSDTDGREVGENFTGGALPGVGDDPIDMLDGGEDDPCPPGMILDPETNQCVPIEEATTEPGISLGDTTRPAPGEGTVRPPVEPTPAEGITIRRPKQFAMGGVATPNIDKMLNTRRFAQGGAVTPNIDSFVRSLRG